MMDVFQALKGLLNLNGGGGGGGGGACVDNWVFRAHTKLTVLVLIGCSVLVTSRQYFGNPISCVAEGVPKDVMEAYCWVYSTFTLPGRLGERADKDAVVRTGVGPYVDGRDQVRYHNYYQWVGFALFLQAVAFYASRYAWRLCEGGRVQALVAADAKSRRAMVRPEERDARKKLLLEYFTVNMHSHRWYAARFFACELFNAGNAVAQVLFMDQFFGHQFTAYGAQVLRYGRAEPEQRDDPMSRVFPKVTKCTFHMFGASGTVQRLDGLCVLALNALNEKIFVFLWFYLLGLIAVTAGGLVYRLAVLTVPWFRARVLKWNTRNVPRSRIARLVRKCHVGDWFVLCQLRKNVNELLFDEFLCELADYLDSRKRVKTELPIMKPLQFIGNNIVRC